MSSLRLEEYRQALRCCVEKNEGKEQDKTVMKSIQYLLCVLGVLFVSSARLCADDWPNWMGPNKNGIISGNPPADPGKTNWRSKVGIGFSSVVVVGDRLITMGHDGNKTNGKETVWCLDVKTGEPLWSDSYAAPLLDNLHVGGPAATPLIDGDRVYTLSRDGQLHCYSLDKGKRLWQRSMMEEAVIPWIRGSDSGSAV